MFRNAVPLFKLYGIQLRIDPSWLLIAGLILWSLSTQYFPLILPRAGSGTHFVLALLGMLGLFASLILHELAHSLTARNYGLGIAGITLFVFGGVAEMEEEPPTPGAEFWIAVAGPAMSFALALAFDLAGPLVAGLGTGAVALMGYLVFVNTALGVFNLIPAYPMDGGRVLRAILWKRSGSMDRATMQAARTGIALGALVIGLGVLSLAGGGGIGGMWTILIGFFVFSAARNNFSAARYRLDLMGTLARDLMTPSPVVVPPAVSVTELVDKVMLPRHMSFIPVVEHGRLLGYVDSAGVRAVPEPSRAQTAVAAVMVPLDQAATLAPDTPAQVALEMFLRTGLRRFLVVEEDRLCGILSLSDMRGFLALKEELAG